MRESPPAWTRWLALSALVVVLDLATKALVSSYFQYGEVREVTPFFNLVLVHNTGAAFSFLAQAGGWQRWFFTVVAVVISSALVWMLRKPGNGALLSCGLALVLGGALGNLYDRTGMPGLDWGLFDPTRSGERVHAVRDFFLLAWRWDDDWQKRIVWPNFNIADGLLVCGAIALLLLSMRKQDGQEGHVVEKLAS